MSTHKHIDIICIVTALLTLLVTVLFMNGNKLGITPIASEENSDDIFTENDKDPSWDTSNAARITLSDSGSTVSGNGAYVSDGNVHIVYAGKYIVSGSISNGQIMIDADGDDKIWLMLDGASIHCDGDAALRIEQAGKVFVTLKDGTENTVSSGKEYTEEAISAGVDGTVYSRDDLTFNGSGSLNVTAEYRHGIVCNDDLVITGGNITVSAVQDGLRANDSVRIKDAGLTVSAGDDGITVSNDENTSYLYIESGNISIPSCYEGLEALKITVAGGTVDIAPEDDGINANGYGENPEINITGGEITIINQNGRDADGLDSNGSIFISGGKLFISVSDDGGSSAIDYGSEYGGVCEISGGTVVACGSSGMAEGFDSSSTQGFLMYNTSAKAGTVVSVKDSYGNEFINETVPCSFSSVLVSAPEMKIGDTCTISVGGNEEEVTIDNSSVGGNGIPGKNGFGRGQIPGGMGGEQPTDGDDTQINGRPTNATPADVPLNSAGSETQTEDEPDSPSLPDGQDDNAVNNGMQPPMRPDGSNSDGTPPAFPHGKTDGNGTPPDVPQGDENSGEPPDGGKMPSPDSNGISENTPSQENGFQTENTDAPVSTESLILLAVSALILAAGCLIAFLYR